MVPTLATILALLEDGEALGLPPVSQEKLRQVSGGVLQGLQVMRRTGLKIGFGTDLLGAQQDRQGTEFALRAQVFEPVEILRQATSINAELLRMEDRIGRVAPGLHRRPDRGRRRSPGRCVAARPRRRQPAGDHAGRAFHKRTL